MFAPGWRPALRFLGLAVPGIASPFLTTPPTATECNRVQLTLIMKELRFDENAIKEGASCVGRRLVCGERRRRRCALLARSKGWFVVIFPVVPFSLSAPFARLFITWVSIEHLRFAIYD